MPRKFENKKLGWVAECVGGDFVVKKKGVFYEKDEFKLPLLLLENSEDWKEMTDDWIDKVWSKLRECGTLGNEDFRELIEQHLPKTERIVQPHKTSIKENKFIQDQHKVGSKNQVYPPVGTCTLKEAMEILGTPNRRNIDMPVSLGKIKRASKKGERLLLDRQSVIDYKNSKGTLEHRKVKKQQQYVPRKYGKEADRIKQKQDSLIVEGQGIRMELPVNNPSQILGEDFDE